MTFLTAVLAYRMYPSICPAKDPKDARDQTSLKYGDADVESADFVSIALPILDDPALSCTLPQYGQVVLQSLFVFA